MEEEEQSWRTCEGSGEERHMMGAWDASGDTEEECESLGGSLELYGESPWDGSWCGGLKSVEHRVNTEAARRFQRRRCPKTQYCSEGKVKMSRQEQVEVQRGPEGCEIGGGGVF